MYVCICPGLRCYESHLVSRRHMYIYAVHGLYINLCVYICKHGACVQFIVQFVKSMSTPVAAARLALVACGLLGAPWIWIGWSVPAPSPVPLPAVDTGEVRWILGWLSWSPSWLWIILVLSLAANGLFVYRAVRSALHPAMGRGQSAPLGFPMPDYPFIPTGISSRSSLFPDRNGMGRRRPFQNHDEDDSPDGDYFWG